MIIKILPDDSAFILINRYAVSKCECETYRLIGLDRHEDAIYYLDNGTYIIDDVKLVVNNDYSKPITSSVKEHPSYPGVIEIHVDKQETATNFIRDAKNFIDLKNPKSKDMVVVRTYKNIWRIASEYPRRSLDTIIMSDNIPNKLLNRIDHFLLREEEYGDYGIPYKYTCLITGLPGTGKSTLISLVASHTNRDLCYLSITPEMDEASMACILGSLPKKSILVIEDVDVICQSSSSNRDQVLSVLTNALDGSLRKHGLICMMTTTDINKVDETLMRPGRIDYILPLKPGMTREQCNQIVKKMTGSLEHIDALWKVSRKLSPSVLVHFLFFHKDSIMENIDQLSVKTKTGGLYL